jgi:hypothetical protein
MTALRRLLILGALLLPALPAFATQVVPLDTRELTLGSSDIVVGTVESVRSYWTANRSRILTDVTVRVSESLKGEAATLTLTQMGGEVDGMKLSVEGSPVFRVGQEVLLFAWRDRNGRAQVNGLAQGKFDVTRDPATGVPMVSRSLEGLAMRRAGTAGIVRAEAPASRRLSVLLDDVRGILAGETPRPRTEEGGR